jgi:periplasmic protein TonB
MFDKLVESTSQKRPGRARRYFLTTTLAYAAGLTTLAVATVFWFNPALAETAGLAASLAPPPVPSGPPPAVQRARPQPERAFASPTTPPARIADPREVPPSNPHPRHTPRDYIIGAPGPASGSYVGPPTTGGESAEPPPPPPPPTPIGTPTPAPKQEVVRLTSTVLQGKAVRRVQPPYPHIAKIGRISGPVQVQVMISQDGSVDGVTALSGHPLLRDAALQAARQWVFSPTVLNGQPVRVVGVITFNFMLN